MRSSTIVGGPTAAQSLTRAAAAGSAGPADTAQQLAWQREMERAQLAGWFKPSATVSATGASPTQGRLPAGLDSGRQEGAPAPMPRSASRVLDSLAANPWMSGAVEGGAQLPIQPPRAAAPLLAGVRVAGQTSPQGDVLAAPPAPQTSRLPIPFGALPAAMAPEPGVDGPSDLQASRQSQPWAATESPALRLHAESTPDGQAVWIAMRADDSSLPAVLPRIVADLQRGLLERGQRLHQVVCNGRLVWRDGVMTGEPHPVHSKEP